jgi:hypothetical protein
MDGASVCLEVCGFPPMRQKKVAWMGHGGFFRDQGFHNGFIVERDLPQNKSAKNLPLGFSSSVTNL